MTTPRRSTPRRSTTRRYRHRAAHKRAGSACHICGDPIDYTLPWTDPMAFVVDHVVPLKRGGKDELSNARAAHALCNARKGSKDFAPIVRRSGALD